MTDKHPDKAQSLDAEVESSKTSPQAQSNQAKGKDTSDMIKGCPSILVPTNSDWSPTERDMGAPPVLPSRSFRGNIRAAKKVRPGRPLRTIPASFERLPPPRNEKGPTYSSFKPFYLPGLHWDRIANGFEPRYPSSIMVDHDVSAVDWDRFLINLRVAGALRFSDYFLTRRFPSPILLIGAIYGHILTPSLALRRRQNQYTEDVLSLVEIYQYRFFVPRNLDVFVACGNQRLTGYFPGDRRPLSGPPVEIGLRVTDSEIQDVPFLNSKALAKLQREDLNMYKKRIVTQREAELNEERKAGMLADKQGKYRLVVQPLGAP